MTLGLLRKAVVSSKMTQNQSFSSSGHIHPQNKKNPVLLYLSSISRSVSSIRVCSCSRFPPVIPQFFITAVVVQYSFSGCLWRTKSWLQHMWYNNHWIKMFYSVYPLSAEKLPEVRHNAQHSAFMLIAERLELLCLCHPYKWCCCGFLGKLCASLNG